MSDDLTTMEAAALTAYEQTISRGLRTFLEVGRALTAIRDARLYRASYSTFDDYCRDRWSLTHSRAYQLMDAAAVVETLQSSTIVEVLPERESQVRPLTKLDPSRQVEVWQAAVATSPRPTAKAVTVLSRTDERLEESPWPIRKRILAAKRIMLEQAIKLLRLDLYDLPERLVSSIDPDDAEGAGYEVLESSLVERLARRLVKE